MGFFVKANCGHIPRLELEQGTERLGIRGWEVQQCTKSQEI
jgi:hypothetical protein